MAPKPLFHRSYLFKRTFKIRQSFTLFIYSSGLQKNNNNILTKVERYAVFSETNI